MELKDIVSDLIENNINFEFKPENNYLQIDIFKICINESKQAVIVYEGEAIQYIDSVPQLIKTLIGGLEND